MKVPLFVKLRFVKKISALWNQSDTARDAGIPDPEGIRLTADIPYAQCMDAKDNTTNLTDIYYPAGEELQAYPTIINVHGGGWFYGNKQIYSTYAKFLAGQGFAVVNFNYRLAPRNTSPAAFEDVCKLMEFIGKNADKYHLDLSRMYMVGDSAGAHLLTQYSIFISSEAYRNLFPEFHFEALPKPQRIALNCGVYELDETRKQGSADLYLPNKLTTQQSESAFRMLNYLNADFPRCFLMTCVNDGLYPQTQMMKERLTENNIPFVYREYGQGTQDNHVFHLNLRSDEGKRCNSNEIAFFLDILPS